MNTGIAILCSHQYSVNLIRHFVIRFQLQQPMSHESASKRRKINDQEPASVAAQPSVTTTTTELPVDPKTWTIDQVYQWAVDIVKVEPEDAQKLKTQKITGDVLHGMTREELKSYGIPGGPAFKLSEAVRKLFPSMDASHGSSRPFTFSKLIICGRLLNVC